MQDVYKNTEEYNSGMSSDMISDIKLNKIVIELVFRGRKLNISIVFITQSYFAVRKISD